MTEKTTLQRKLRAAQHKLNRSRAELAKNWILNHSDRFFCKKSYSESSVRESYLCAFDFDVNTGVVHILKVQNPDNSLLDPYINSEKLYIEEFIGRIETMIPCSEDEYKSYLHNIKSVLLSKINQ